MSSRTGGWAVAGLCRAMGTSRRRLTPVRSGPATKKRGWESGLGRCPDAGEYFNGSIDQVRVYSRALNDSEVASFTDYRCKNRQRTIECVNNPELCNTTTYASGPSEERYHCNYGRYDDPTRNSSTPNSDKVGVGVCCPQDLDAEYDTFNNEWKCTPTETCGVQSGDFCEYNISSSEDAWFASQSDGSSNACNSQVDQLHADTGQQGGPEEKSQACCYVAKDGQEGFFYKDGNVKVYG